MDTRRANLIKDTMAEIALVLVFVFALFATVTATDRNREKVTTPPVIVIGFPTTIKSGPFLFINPPAIINQGDGGDSKGSDLGLLQSELLKYATGSSGPSCLYLRKIDTRTGGLIYGKHFLEIIEDENAPKIKEHSLQPRSLLSVELFGDDSDRVRVTHNLSKAEGEIDERKEWITVSEKVQSSFDDVNKALISSKILPTFEADFEIDDKIEPISRSMSVDEFIDRVDTLYNKVAAFQRVLEDSNLHCAYYFDYGLEDDFQGRPVEGTLKENIKKIQEAYFRFPRNSSSHSFKTFH